MRGIQRRLSALELTLLQPQTRRRSFTDREIESLLLQIPIGDLERMTPGEKAAREMELYGEVSGRPDDSMLQYTDDELLNIIIEGLGPDEVARLLKTS